MYIEDRLFSENTEETLYSILMDEDEYTLYSEFCSLFSKDEDGIDKEDLAKAAAIAGGATGIGAGVGKVLQVQGQKKLKKLVSKRALQGAGIGAATESGIIGALEASRLHKLNEVARKLNSKYIRISNPTPEILRSATAGVVGGATHGSAIGAIEGQIEKYLKEKQLKKLVKKGGKAGLAAGALASTGYLAHKASKKKKKN